MHYLTNQTNKYKSILFLIVLLIFISPIINNILSPRAFNLDSMNINILEKSQVPYQIRLILTGITLILSCLLIYPAIKQKVPKSLLQLWTAAMFLALGPVLSIFLGTKKFFDIQWIVFILCMSILLLLRKSDFYWYVGLGRIISLIYIYGSLVVAIFIPKISIEENYTQGFLFSLRLHGIANLANHLAPIILLFWVSDRLIRKNINFISIIHYLLSILVLILTQSKTTWIAIFVILIMSYITTLSSYRRIIVIMFGGALCIVLISISYNYATSYASGLTDHDINFITSLSGRNLVWDFTIDLWKENPWFGYGLGIWKDETRVVFMSLYNWAPGQAHNQFFQTLGSSGIVGVLGLVFYLITLFIFGIRYAKKSGLASMILVLLLIIRGFTESDMVSNMFTENFVIHFFTYGLLVLLIQNGNGIIEHSSSPSILQKFIKTKSDR